MALMLASLLQDAPGKDRVDRAVALAHTYFVATQHAAEGWISDTGANRTAMTSLAVLALAATGHQPTDTTPEGQCMRKAINFVLRPENQDAQGFFGARDGSRMYGHGITTLMLSEMAGMGVDAEMDKLLRERCEQAVALIVRSQAARKDPGHEGGWRYLPDSRDSDLSVTVWQLMALRSAKNSCFHVPKESIAKAVEYVKRCYKVERAGRKGACAYLPDKAPEFAMAAAGLLSLQVCGDYACPEVVGSADWLLESKLDWKAEWFFYGMYYFAQGMSQRGEAYATSSRRLVDDILLPKQARDGSWLGHGQEQKTGKVYCTALAVLSLAVKYHYLPIYQR